MKYTIFVIGLIIAVLVSTYAQPLPEAAVVRLTIIGEWTVAELPTIITRTSINDLYTVTTRTNYGSGIIISNMLLTAAHIIDGASRIIIANDTIPEISINVDAASSQKVYTLDTVDAALVELPTSPAVPEITTITKPVQIDDTLTLLGYLSNQMPIHTSCTVHRTTTFDIRGYTLPVGNLTRPAFMSCNSGAPLFTSNGALAGIAVINYSLSNIPYGYYIPIHTAWAALQSIRNGEPAFFPYLGLVTHRTDIADGVINSWAAIEQSPLAEYLNNDGELPSCFSDIDCDIYSNTYRSCALADIECYWHYRYSTSSPSNTVKLRPDVFYLAPNVLLKILFNFTVSMHSNSNGSAVVIDSAGKQMKLKPGDEIIRIKTPNAEWKNISSVKELIALVNSSTVLLRNNDIVYSVGIEVRRRGLIFRKIRRDWVIASKYNIVIY